MLVSFNYKTMYRSNLHRVHWVRDEYVIWRAQFVISQAKSADTNVYILKSILIPLVYIFQTKFKIDVKCQYLVNTEHIYMLTIFELNFFNIFCTIWQKQLKGQYFNHTTINFRNIYCMYRIYYFSFRELWFIVKFNLKRFVDCFEFLTEPFLPINCFFNQLNNLHKNIIRL